MQFLETISEFISFLMNKLCKNFIIFILKIAKFFSSIRKDKNSDIVASNDFDIIDISFFS